MNRPQPRIPTASALGVHQEMQSMFWEKGEEMVAKIKELAAHLKEQDGKKTEMGRRKRTRRAGWTPRMPQNEREGA